ncbi:MAG: ADP-heptose--LPS heptosyltransferase RfaF [Bacteroidia bacterium]|nr:MAG: ADP-heptose--LPS heptosyltransferase RfaF [Bacteroidia bacterium]
MRKKTNKVLIIRLSAMGDVAMVRPVAAEFCEKNPDLEIYLLTRKAFAPFFADIPGLHLLHPDFRQKHKGFYGLFCLFREIKRTLSPSLILDLHDVLRTKILRFLFRLSGIPSYKIDKGRKEKKQLIQSAGEYSKPLKHTTRRYADVFARAGFPLKLEKGKYILPTNMEAEEARFLSKTETNIGIAPFARHLSKQIPEGLLREIITELSKRKCKILIFGGGQEEQQIADKLTEEFARAESVIGQLALPRELALIAHLDAMITADSANMHMAALVNTKIISIWGATHPFAGFTPFISDEKLYIFQNNNLSYRPLSIYGNTSCTPEQIREMYDLPADQIADACLQEDAQVL